MTAFDEFQARHEARTQAAAALYTELLDRLDRANASLTKLAAESDGTRQARLLGKAQGVSDARKAVAEAKEWGHAALAIHTGTQTAALSEVDGWLLASSYAAERPAF